MHIVIQYNFQHHLHEQYEIQDCSPKKYKDVNEQLVKTDVKNHQIRIQ